MSQEEKSIVNLANLVIRQIQILKNEKYLDESEVFSVLQKWTPNPSETGWQVHLPR